jgi:hypothetical protein
MAQAVGDKSVNRLASHNIRDCDLVRLSDSVASVLGLKARGEVEVIGEITDMMTELEIETEATNAFEHGQNIEFSRLELSQYP